MTKDEILEALKALRAVVAGKDKLEEANTSTNDAGEN